MILISEIYSDVVLDNINDVENIKPPTPYTAQKDKDWLSLYINKNPVQVINGLISKPAGYYQWENAYLLRSSNDTTTCDESDIPVAGCNTSIELLDGDKFYERCNTYIEGLQPSFTKPICKEVGNTFEFLPQDLGSITLEYIKYPVYGKIVPKFDSVYNEEVIDEALSTNYQYEEWARELLIYFISEAFGIHTRENALQQQLKSTGALVRDAKQ